MQATEQTEAAMRHLASGAWWQAEQAARSAARDDPAAALVAGLAVAAMGEASRAAPILLHAAALRTAGDHPCLALARLEPELPRPMIGRQFQACIDLRPDDDRLRLAFAEHLLDSDRAAEAEAALAGGPETAARQHLLGMAYAEQDRFPQAMRAFEAAVALDPAAAAAWSNLGMMLKTLRAFPRSIEAHDRAVSLEPANPRFRVNRAVALLKAGDWSRAWLDYEARLDLPDTPAIDRARLLPSAESLAGRTVLALHEDGFGDTLQFLRYLPLLAERGARVVALVPRALERLMALVPRVDLVVTDPRRLPDHDFVCPMFSLPRVFGTTVDTVPPVPPITLDPALVRHWRSWLPMGGLRAGLVWAGQARPSLPGFVALDRRRSALLAATEPLFGVPGVWFVSLQAGPAAGQTRLPGMDLVDPMPAVRDFADTAAIIAGLDVVISVDTAVAHLAGLLGKPVFLLDRHDGCWRWLDGRSDSPWYPNLTIFRQDEPGDWSQPVHRAAQALRAMARQRA